MAGATIYTWPDTCGCACLTGDLVSHSTPCELDWHKSPTIEMICVSEFRDHILQSVADVPAAMVDNAVMRAANDFAKRTKTLRRWLKADLQVDRNEYKIRVTGEETLNEVHRICVEGRCLDVFDGACSSSCETRYDSFWHVWPDTVMVSAHFCKDKQDGLAFDISTAPDVNGSKLDAIFYTRHLRAIISGATEILRSSDKKYGFFDMNLAKAARQDFLFETERAESAFVRSRHGPIRKVHRSGMG